MITPVIDAERGGSQYQSFFMCIIIQTPDPFPQVMSRLL